MAHGGRGVGELYPAWRAEAVAAPRKTLRATGVVFPAGPLCYGAVVRNTLKRDDLPLLAAWLLWEMFCGDDDARPSDGARSGEGDPQPPPSPVSSES